MPWRPAGVPSPTTIFVIECGSHAASAPVTWGCISHGSSSSQVAGQGRVFHGPCKNMGLALDKCHAVMTHTLWKTPALEFHISPYLASQSEAELCSFLGRGPVETEGSVGRVSGPDLVIRVSILKQGVGSRDSSIRPGSASYSCMVLGIHELPWASVSSSIKQGHEWSYPKSL